MTRLDPNQTSASDVQTGRNARPMASATAGAAPSAGGTGIPGVRAPGGSVGGTDVPGSTGERGVPNLKQNRKKNNVNKLFFAVAIFVALGAMAMGASVFLKRLQTQHDEARADAKKAPKAASSDDGHDFQADVERLRRQRAAAARQASLAAAASASASPAQSVPAPSGALRASQAGAAAQGKPAPHVETVAERRLDGDVLISTSSDGHSASGSTNPSGGDPARPMASRAPTDGLDASLTPSQLASVKPSFLPDLDYLLKRGEIIPCGQRTKIDTTYPGMTSCIVSRDVYSADGRTLLIEAGSEATGEQRKALMQGQARIMVLWSRLDMPNGVTVPLDSPGTDSLGASGLNAYVDTHFWQRFGGALMVSLIGDVGQAASNRSLGSGNNQIQFSNTSTAGQGLAEETLKNTINIPPTAYSNQGSALNIFVARDVDFRSVYELEQQ